MKRLVSGLLALALAAAGLTCVAPAYADGLGAPLINGPVEGQVFEQGDVVHFDVSFADAPYGTYQLNIFAPDGTLYFTATKFHEAGPNPVAIFERTPETVGSYDFSITYDTGGGSEVADVHFSVEEPTPQAPSTTPSPSVVVKRPSAPRSAHTAVASKKVRLLWAAPALTGGAAITGYQVKRGTQIRNLGAGVRSALFTRLKNKRTYAFSVRARNRAGFSSWVTRVRQAAQAEEGQEEEAPQGEPPGPARTRGPRVRELHRHAPGLPARSGPPRGGGQRRRDGLLRQRRALQREHQERQGQGRGRLRGLSGDGSFETVAAQPPQEPGEAALRNLPRGGGPPRSSPEPRPGEREPPGTRGQVAAHNTLWNPGHGSLRRAV